MKFFEHTDRIPSISEIQNMKFSFVLENDFTCKLWLLKSFMEHAAMNNQMITESMSATHFFILYITRKTKKRKRKRRVIDWEVFLSSSLDEKNLSLWLFLLFMKICQLNLLSILLLIFLVESLQTLRYLNNLIKHMYMNIWKNKRTIKENPTEYY